MYKHLNVILDLCSAELFLNGTVSKQMWNEKSPIKQVTGTLKEAKARFTLTVTPDVSDKNTVLVELKSPRDFSEEAYRISVTLPLDRKLLSEALSTAVGVLSEHPPIEGNPDILQSEMDALVKVLFVEGSESRYDYVGDDFNGMLMSLGTYSLSAIARPSVHVKDLSSISAVIFLHKAGEGYLLNVRFPSEIVPHFQVSIDEPMELDDWAKLGRKASAHVKAHFASLSATSFNP